MFHVRGANAIWRLDRDRNSAALQFHRFPTGDFTTPWKGFIIGVDASESGVGEFFISDYGTSVSGGSTRRLTINNDGDVLVASNLAVDTDTLFVDSVGKNVGIGKTNPGVALDVVGATSISGDLAVATNKFTVASGTGNTGIAGTLGVAGTAPSTSTTTGALVVGGGVGVGGNVHVGGKVFVPNDGDFVMDSKPLKAATGLSWDRNASRLNVAGSVTMTGGLITNTSGVRKKTYSQTGTHSGTASLSIAFSAFPFSAKVTAHLISSSSISTLIYDCTGGFTGGSIVNGPISIFGGEPAWSTSITTTDTSITITPAASGATSYNIFVEYISASATGSVTTIASVSTGY
jgi:hypothetical protein